MQDRKVISVGGTSLAVILPKAWARFYGIVKGTKVKVISDDELRIIPPKNLRSSCDAKAAQEHVDNEGGEGDNRT